MKNIIKKIGFLALTVFIVTSCQLGPEKGKSTNASNDQGSEVLEVLQTSSYTYLRVDKDGAEQWIAVMKGEYNTGDMVFYEPGLEMKQFKSPELNRTFETVFFVQEISNQPLASQMQKEMPPQGGGMTGTEPKKPVLKKLDISIVQPEGGISIAELYANRKNYEGKLVKVKGQVTKVNEGIMGRNWVHIQDGTADGENFDLTVTTDDGPMVGEIITFSGTLSLNKDFGAGYTYEVILEEAMPVADH